MIYTVIFPLKYWLPRVNKVTQNANLDKWSYSGYAIRLFSWSPLLISSFDFGKTVIILGADNNSSTHTDNRRTDTRFRQCYSRSRN